MSNIRMNKEQKNERKLNDVIRFSNLVKTSALHLFRHTEDMEGRVWEKMDDYCEYIENHYVGPDRYKPKTSNRYNLKADAILRSWRAGKMEGNEERYTNKFVSEFMMKWLEHYVAINPSVEKMKMVRESIRGVFLNQDLLDTHGKFFLTWNTYQDPYDHEQIVLRKHVPNQVKSSLIFPTLPANLISKMESWCILNLDDKIDERVKRNKTQSNIRSVGYSVNNIIKHNKWIVGYQDRIANVAPTYEHIEGVGDALCKWLDTMPSIEGAGEYNNIIRVEHLKSVIKHNRPSEKVSTLNNSIEISERSIDNSKKAIQQCLDWLGMTIDQWYQTAKDTRQLHTTETLDDIKASLGYGGEEE